MIVWHGERSFGADVTGPHFIDLPGTAALEAIERHIDYARLPAVPREMLERLREGLDAGTIDAKPAGGRDAVGTRIGEAVGVIHFDEMVERAKENETRPWASRPEGDKVRDLIDLAQVAGPPVDYTLSVIEREVDTGKLPAWRRKALDDMRRRIDAGEFADDDRNSRSHDDRAGLALYLSEFRARVEDEKRLGALDYHGARHPWQDLSELEKLEDLTIEMENLHLSGEPRAYQAISREVDLSRVPAERRQAFEANWREARHGPQPSEALTEEFRRVVGRISEQWTLDGFAAVSGRWEGLSAEQQIGYLADLAGAHHVSFEEFTAAARQVLGVTPGQELSPDDESNLRTQYGAGQHQLARLQADQNQRTRTAARMAELEATVESRKHSADRDSDGKLRLWQDLRPEEKFDRLISILRDLRLQSEPAAWHLLAREVDITRLPEDRRRAWERGAVPRQRPRARRCRRQRWLSVRGRPHPGRAASMPTQSRYEEPGG
jgi:hypothetical protein